MTVLVFLLLLYLGLWPLWLLTALPFAVLTLASFGRNNRRIVIRKKAQFAASLLTLAPMVFPAVWHAINIELGELMLAQSHVSPDGTREIILSYRSTSRSVNWIDSSCRVHLTLRHKSSGVAEDRRSLDFDEVSDAERPQIEWLSDKVRTRFWERTIELQRKS